MKPAFLEKITIEKTLIYILIGAAIITFIFISYLFIQHFTKSVKITSPLGGEEWGIDQTYTIAWKTRGIDRVGIALFKGKEPKWIARNILAAQGKYDWKIYPGQPYGDDYWIAVFEYPWKKGNRIAYSKASFAIVFPEFFSCDDLSVQKEWSHLPSDLPNLRRMFITSAIFTGNLEGLDGADKKCQTEADNQKLGGKWHAFIGGDGEQESAVERMKETPRKTDGTFVIAQPAATLLRGATCHRLIAKSFDEFLKKLSDLAIVNQAKFEEEFFKDLGKIWLGRMDERSAKNCTAINSVLNDPYVRLERKYSATTTCQNWTQAARTVAGYPVPEGTSKPPFPTCYTAQGKLTDAVAVGGLVVNLTGGGPGASSYDLSKGEYCDSTRKLICIEE